MTESHKFDLSVVGELNLDLILYGLPVELELDREHLASDLRLTLGSSSAIFAHNFALLGNRVGFNSAIGKDALGGLCLSRLAESGAEELDGGATHGFTAPRLTIAAQITSASSSEQQMKNAYGSARNSDHHSGHSSSPESIDRMRRSPLWNSSLVIMAQ